MSCLPTIHFFTPQLISAVDPKFLKLTKSDDQIYTKFREAFPDLSIQVLDPTLLKSDEAKEVWKAPTYVILDLKSWEDIKIISSCFTEMEAFLQPVRWHRRGLQLWHVVTYRLSEGLHGRKHNIWYVWIKVYEMNIKGNIFLVMFLNHHTFKATVGYKHISHFSHQNPVLRHRDCKKQGGL